MRSWSSFKSCDDTQSVCNRDRSWRSLDVSPTKSHLRRSEHPTFLLAWTERCSESKWSVMKMNERNGAESLIASWLLHDTNQSRTKKRLNNSRHEPQLHMLDESLSARIASRIWSVAFVSSKKKSESNFYLLNRNEEKLQYTIHRTRSCKVSWNAKTNAISNLILLKNRNCRNNLKLKRWNWMTVHTMQLTNQDQVLVAIDFILSPHMQEITSEHFRLLIRSNRRTWKTRFWSLEWIEKFLVNRTLFDTVQPYVREKLVVIPKIKKIYLLNHVERQVIFWSSARTHMNMKHVRDMLTV